MARYIVRKCPKCREYLAVAIAHRSSKSREIPIIADCDLCGYQLKGWRLILGGKRPLETLTSRMRKALS